MTGILQAILSFFGVTPSTSANYIEDVFSTYLYTGTASAITINNGIDLSTKGGLVWTKVRSSANDHVLIDTVRGSNQILYSNYTFGNDTNSTAITAFNSSGYVYGTYGAVNQSGQTYASWTFREQAKFFDVVTYTGNGSNRTIAHNLGSVPGCIIIKRTDTAADWQVYHRSLANTEYLVLNSTAAKATGTTRWNSTTPTSTEFSLGTDSTVNANGGTYVAYLFAHDAGGFGASGTDNVISCGSSVGGGSAGTVSVNLGYEPQWVLLKNASNASFGGWELIDNMRGWPVSSAGENYLFANSSAAEATGGYWTGNPTATGFTHYAYAGETYIYIAIRRGPMKTPTSGTSVFTSITRAGTGANATVSGIGFNPDLVMSKATVSGWNWNQYDRMRGRYLALFSTLANAEVNLTTALTGFDVQNGYTLGADATYQEINYSGYNYYNYHFGRAPGFFDVVCYTGTGSAKTESHNLGVTPELMIVKNRSDATGRAWAVYAGDATDYLVFNTTAATADDIAYWNDTAPTSSVFTVGTSNSTNESGDTFVAYLFATVAGVSKVGSYTGTGTTLQVDCGFTAGARFVMIKRTDSTGDWYVWDSAQGIVAGNDPYLRINSNGAQVTNTDYVDTYNAGFEISSTAPAAINANGGTFIFLAIA